jgi:Tol biopolymer transport system component
MRTTSPIIRLLVVSSIAVSVVALPTAAQATSPGANGRIVFASRAVGGTYDVFTMNPNGSGLVNVTNHLANDRDPAISPDGTKIMFRTDRDGNDEIYVMNADGTNPIRLTNDPQQDYAPSWSPDGTEFVWVRQTPSLPPFMHVMNADGTNDHILGVGSTPQFSPDGEKLAFWGRVDRANPDVVAVFLMNADGTHLRQVTPSSLNGAMPAWAPDGNRLVFSSEVCGLCVESDLYTIKANGKDLRRLTYYVGTGANAHEAVWSPNGKQILFTHWDNPAFSTADLYVVNVDGTGIANVTNATGLTEREADWETLTEE